eukprot:1367499-Rhodomonas_salina.2
MAVSHWWPTASPERGTERGYVEEAKHTCARPSGDSQDMRRPVLVHSVVLSLVGPRNVRRDVCCDGVEGDGASDAAESVERLSTIAGKTRCLREAVP